VTTAWWSKGNARRASVALWCRRRAGGGVRCVRAAAGGCERAADGGAVEFGRRMAACTGGDARQTARECAGGGATSGGAASCGAKTDAAGMQRAAADGGFERATEGGQAASSGRVSGAVAREIYDMWTPQIFLSPVDPMLRV
jgi:hypothetical protein